NVLIGPPFVTAKPSTLARCGIGAQRSASQVIMALYSDKNGKPDQLLAFSNPVALAGGLQEIPAPAVALPAGRYWVLTVFDGPSMIHADQNSGFDDWAVV